ncbi:quinoprotein relay system zinc metallohydrolase 1 [Rhodobacter capsulatus]|uniref:quinoprotein relay system zinc metallohydrolase 1 n=1 Tax=Rhodobacter capsulatus TaxID=1061 RepID=UPI0003D35B80|nr:metallo-beta-lactamase [Rhodobacter capsulatus YW1]
MTGGTRIRRRSLMLGGVAGAAALALPRPVQAQAKARGDYGFAPVQVAPGVWLIEGARQSLSPANGGAIANIALLETPQGAIVIDTGSTARMGAEIRAFADQRLGGVVTTLITHHHPDHWFGNAAFADAPLLSLGATALAARANAQGYSDALYALLGSWMSGTTPVPPAPRIETGRQVIAGRGLRLLPLCGHTQADLAILDEATGTLIAGDLLFLDRAPSLPDADLTLWQASLAQLGALSPAGTIPGHGPYHRSLAALTQTRACLAATDARLAQAAALGLSPAEAMAAGPVPEFARLGANPEEYHRSVSQRWSSYEDRALRKIRAA